MSDLDPNVNIADEPNILGDYASSNSIPNDQDPDCSGGYGDCEESSSDTGKPFGWPPEAPIPDDTNKLPKVCPIFRNDGKPNDDVKIPLNSSKLKDVINKPAVGIIKNQTARPTVIPTKL